MEMMWTKNFVCTIFVAKAGAVCVRCSRSLRRCPGGRRRDALCERPGLNAPTGPWGADVADSFEAPFDQ